MPCQKCTGQILYETTPLPYPGSRMSYTEPQLYPEPMYDGRVMVYPSTGAIAPTTKYLVGGIVIGSLATLFFIHLTGATSVRGAARATGRAVKKMW